MKSVTPEEMEKRIVEWTHIRINIEGWNGKKYDTGPCPSCGQAKVSNYHGSDLDGDTLYCYMNCDNCNAHYNLLFKMVGISMSEVIDKFDNVLQEGEDIDWPEDRETPEGDDDAYPEKYA